MELIYIVLFVLFAVPAAVLEYTENSCFGWADRRRGQQATDKEYLRFRNNYVIVFSLMMGETYAHQAAQAMREGSHGQQCR